MKERISILGGTLAPWKAIPAMARPGHPNPVKPESEQLAPIRFSAANAP